MLWEQVELFYSDEEYRSLKLSELCGMEVILNVLLLVNVDVENNSFSVVI